MTLIDLGMTGPEPVTVPDAKAWCRIDRDDEDGLIERLIRAARETVEAETRLVLARRAFRLIADPVPEDRAVEVRRGPLHRVVSAVVFGSDGTAEAIVAEAIGIRRTGGRTFVCLPEAAVRGAANGAEIEFEAGYAAGETPEGLLLAIRRIVAASFEMRGLVAEGMQPAAVPGAAKALMARFREVRL